MVKWRKLKQFIERIQDHAFGHQSNRLVFTQFNALIRLNTVLDFSYGMDAIVKRMEENLKCTQSLRIKSSEHSALQFELVYKKQAWALEKRVYEKKPQHCSEF